MNININIHHLIKNRIINKKLLGNNSGVFTIEFVILMPIFLFIWFVILDVSSMYSEKHKFRLDLYYLVRALSFEYNDKDNLNHYGSTNDNDNVDHRLAKNLNIDVCKGIGEKYKINYKNIKCESKEGVITIEAIKQYKLKFLSLTFLNYIYKLGKNDPDYKSINMKEKIIMSNESFLNQDSEDWAGRILFVCNLQHNNKWKKWIKELSKMKMDK